MSLTKRWLETQPGAMCIAARIIEAESPLDWQDRQAAGRALAFATMRLVELESLLDTNQAH